MSLSSACFSDDCDWCNSPYCDCPCHDDDPDDWGDDT